MEIVSVKIHIWNNFLENAYILCANPDLFATRQVDPGNYLGSRLGLKEILARYIKLKIIKIAQTWKVEYLSSFILFIN